MTANALQASQRLNEACLCHWSQCSGFAARASEAWQSDYPYFIIRDDYILMAEFISLFSAITERHQYRSLVQQHLPEIVIQPSHAKGVLDGFDFHITATGPKLIEVNTNAGGAYLNTSFNQNNHAFEESIWKMFCAEHQLQQAGSPLSVIVILDEQPKEQFLYPEMLKFKSLFEKQGVQTFILSPEALRLGPGGLYFQNLKVDLIYNRHTDFYLESAAMEQVKQAFLENQVTLTPNPTAYGYRADKRVLTWFSNPGFLDALGLSDHELSFIRQVVPETHLVTSENAEQFWRERKKWFFKPVSGFGSRGVYRGSKLTKNTWQKIVGTGSYKTNNRAGNYVAQSFVPPAKRVVAVDGKEQLLKSDVRHYVYDGSILMSLSRLYHGQATNLRTQGGGFSPLVVL